jgi:hypothetical protein
MFASRKNQRPAPALPGALRVLLSSAAIALLSTGLAAQDPPAPDRPFPDTEKLMAQVTADQKKIEALLAQYTFTDKETVFALDKNWKLHNRHTDTYYITPTAYQFFSLHVSHDGKAMSESNLQAQQKKIEKRMAEDDRKAQKNESIRPKDRLLFADIIARSRFTPLRWESLNGWDTVVYSFEPKATSRPKGELVDRIAGDLKGKMWISPEEQEVVRIEFTSVASLGLGVLGNIKGFAGFVEQQKIHGELWMPTRQEYTAEGRQLFAGFHVRQVSEFSDYLKATTDVFQQIHAPSPASE